MSTNDHEPESKLPVLENDDADNFNPEGMRVLAIDANIVCLRILVALLQKCKYEVMGTTVAAEALKILSDNKNEFDIVITHVIRPDDMDGFRLLEIIALEMDLPVIMVSADDSISNIMKGIRHGARDYLIKPVRVQEIRNIWQHVVRKKLSSSEKSRITKEILMEQKSSKKLKAKAKKEDEHITDHSDGSSTKRKRVTWNPELHRRFVDAVQKLEDSAVVHPKKILDIMNEPGLTRENVSSHLQKFRNMLKKSRGKAIQQINGEIDRNIFGGNPYGKESVGSNRQEAGSSDNNADELITSDSNPFFMNMKSSCLELEIDRNRFGGNPRGKESVGSNLQEAGDGHNNADDLIISDSIPSFMNMKSSCLELCHQDEFRPSNKIIPMPQGMMHNLAVPDFKEPNFLTFCKGMKLPDEYMKATSQSFGYNGHNENDPRIMSYYSYPFAPCFNPSSQMIGAGTSAMSEDASAIRPVQNSVSGEHGGGLSVNLQAGGNSDYSGLPIDQSNNEQCSRQKSFIFLDDDLSEIVKQFLNDVNPPPPL